MRSVNQHALAKRLNLSHTTVSRSLSNHPAISRETRERVQALAAELGYRTAPTRSVRRSREATPITIGVLIGAPLVAADRATFPTILRGIQHRAAVEHASVDVVSLDPAEFSPEAAERHVFRLIRSSGWRGAILIYPFPSVLVKTLSEKLSAVSVLTEYADCSIDVVDTDHHNVQWLVDRLADAGHRRIGFVSWHYPAGGLWAARRFGAYSEALLARGLPINPSWIFNVGSHQKPLETPALIADAAVAAMRRDRVTAWICAADHQAYQLISELQGRGIKVPAACSVAGFDGNEPPPGLPRLMTLRVPNEHIGESAVAQLITRLLYPRSPRRKILVETSLEVGATCAPARGIS